MTAEQSCHHQDIEALTEIFARIAERGRKLRDAQRQSASMGESLVKGMPVRNVVLPKDGSVSHKKGQKAEDLPICHESGKID